MALAYLSNALPLSRHSIEMHPNDRRRYTTYLGQAIRDSYF